MFEDSCKNDIATVAQADQAVMQAFAKTPVQEVAAEGKSTVKGFGKIMSTDKEEFLGEGNGKKKVKELAKTKLAGNAVSWMTSECCSCSRALLALEKTQDRLKLRVRKIEAVGRANG